MSDKKIQCLLIRTNNKVEEISITDAEIPKVLQTRYTDHESLDYLDSLGYRCGVICKDKSEPNDKVNIIASALCKKSQSTGNLIIGDVILMNNKPITKSDLKKILDYANDFDYEQWIIKENERIMKLMEEDFKEIAMNNK